MAVPSTFADLSATPASNSGLISDASAVNVIDDHARTIYAFLASISANSGNGWASPYLDAANPSYTGTLTGGTGVVNLGSGQVYKDASGNVGIGGAPNNRFDVYGSQDSPVVARVSNASLGASATARITLDTQGGSWYIDNTRTNGAFVVGNGANERMRIDASGNQINTPSNTPPTLTVNGQMNLTPTSNTNMRISYRGSDGVTRVANITLA